jgi:homoserine O-acetyltransferase
MPAQIPADSVGIISPKIQRFDEPLKLRSGRVIESYELIYETYGELNSDASNAILICHALSGDHHAAGYHSTGPTSINPETGKAYGPDFPIVAVRDWVRSQKRLADFLNIQQWAAVVGGSLGGMQVLRWTIQYPDRIRHALVIASAPKLSAQNIAFNEVARQAISKDPDFHNGRYMDHGVVPKDGLSQARMLGHLTYMSGDAMKEKFGRELKADELSFSFTPEFQVESYLHYQGQKFSTQFDANTYMLMTKALDYFDPTIDHDGDLVKCLSQAKCKFFVASFSTDWRFAPDRSEEIVNALMQADKDVSYACIESENGHDAFLLPIPRYLDVFSAYMQRVEGDIPALTNKTPENTNTTGDLS